MEGKRLVVEGWRHLPHSYSLVNHHQLLWMRRDPRITVFHRDRPFPTPAWHGVRGLFRAEDAAAVDAVSPPPDDRPPDIVYRIDFPYNFLPSDGARTATFATCEDGAVSPDKLKDGIPLSRQLAAGNTLIVTPSHWSRKGFERSGAPAARIVVIPHGVDTRSFFPVPDTVRATIRRQLGWDDAFIFLNVGAITGNKGIHALLKAFAVVSERFPDARLAIKGMDGLYRSKRNLLEATQSLTESARQRVMDRIYYIGGTIATDDLIRLYRSADGYAAPYCAEGFNLPVLEAVACGLPVICTGGGPTDDFTRPDFAWRIRSRLKQIRCDDGFTRWLLEADVDHLVTLMERMILEDSYRNDARRRGPEFVLEGFGWEAVVKKLLDTLLGD